MPYASAGVRELWFGASSAAAVLGFGEARSRAGGARPLSVGLRFSGRIPFQQVHEVDEHSCN
jgi:hypothetical protein